VNVLPEFHDADFISNEIVRDKMQFDRQGFRKTFWKNRSRRNTVKVLNTDIVVSDPISFSIREPITKSIPGNGAE
jgi:hypothetical protein